MCPSPQASFGMVDDPYVAPPCRKRPVSRSMCPAWLHLSQGLAMTIQERLSPPGHRVVARDPGKGGKLPCRACSPGPRRFPGSSNLRSSASGADPESGPPARLFRPPTVSSNRVRATDSSTSTTSGSPSGSRKRRLSCSRCRRRIVLRSASMAAVEMITLHQPSGFATSPFVGVESIRRSIDVCTTSSASSG